MAYAQSAHSGASSGGGPLQAAPQRQLRTRPVDGSKPLYIVRSVKDLEVLAEEEGVRLDPVSLGFLSPSQFVTEDLTAPAPKKPRTQSIAVPPIQKEKRIHQAADFVQPEYYIRTEAHRDLVSGLRLSDGSTVHYDMLEEDEEFVDALNRKTNRNNIITKKPLYMPAEPGAPDACAVASNAADAAAGLAAETAATTASNGEGAASDSQQQEEALQKQNHPTSGPFRLVLNPICLANKSLFLSDIAFIKLMDALEKEAHARGGSELSVSPDEAARIAAQDLNLGLHAVICKHVHAPSPADTSPLAVFRPRVGREKMTLRKQKRIGKDALVRAEKLLDDCRLVEKVLRRMRTRDEKKEHLLEVRSLMFEQQRFELTDPFYSHPLWLQLREKVKGSGSRRTDRRGDKRALLHAAASASAGAAALPPPQGPPGSASAGAARQQGPPGAPQGPPSDSRQIRRQAKRDRLGRLIPVMSPSLILRPKGAHQTKIPYSFHRGVGWRIVLSSIT
ncbi:enhancer of polycomb-like [Cyclospora cayetanensis]|uniref:Enhancer of polycomb-like n=1 Tax=Cyclospora cayetanensis TaxID=88456 RepID=A0A1D3CU95_9EIME|nr:enhancer of polycomb-like [Cyclospora cayetanensis]